MSTSVPGQGGDIPNLVDQQSGGPSTSQAHASTSKKSTGRRVRTKLKELFSRSTSPSTRPTTPLPPIVAARPEQPQTLRDGAQEVLVPSKLISKRADRIPEDGSETNAKKIALLDLGVGAIDLLRQVSDIAGIVLPNPVGPVLEKVTVVLGTLKSMMQNKESWETLLRTLDNHQLVFNQQLARLKKENLDADSTSPFLGPIKQYSTALEEILAAILKDSGLADRNAPSGGAWEKVKNFSSRFLNAGSEQDQIQGYDRKVSDAMGDLKLALVLYISDKVQEISDKLASNEEKEMLEKLKITGLHCGSSLSGCTGETRQDILRRIKEWTIDFDAPNILWLKGHPGVGKSAIATSVVDNLTKWKRLGSSFFFQRQKATIMVPSVLWCTVAYDLANRYPTLRKRIVTALNANELGPATVNVDLLFRYLVQEPIAESRDIPKELLPIVVIDALDECGGLDKRRSEHRRSLMQTLKSWSRLPGDFKLIVTSRGESDIERLFSATSHHLIEISAGKAVESQSSKDIQAFLTDQFQQKVAYLYGGSLTSGWPGTPVIEDLARRAAGLFIWAETVINFISDGEPQQRLDLVLKGSGAGDLDDLYSQILSTSFRLANEQEVRNFHSVVGTIILAKEPLSFASLQKLLSLDDSTVTHICNGLQSVLESGDTLRFYHQSFVDFLMDPDRCSHQYHIKRSNEHRTLTLMCLRVMEEKLRFNICDLKSSYLRNADVPDLKSRLEKYIPHYVSYSSRFWASHLAETACDMEIFELLQYFMQNQFPFWLEVLSLIKQVNQASSMLRILANCIRTYGKDDAMAAEMQKFVSAFASVISQSAPHIYLSALPFTPRKSAVSKRYLESYTHTLVIRNGGQNDWPAMQNVLSGHEGSVISVSSSPDGTRLVSGASDMTIRIWDAETGEVVVGPLEGHTDRIWSVAFSPDGRRIISGADDRTIRVWDAETGEVVVGPLEGHTDRIRSVAFSPDGRRIISGARDRTIRVWDAETGEVVVGPLKGHTWGINSVAFSPNGRRIISGADDRTIRVWDAETGKVVVGPLEGHTGGICSVAFSPDGRRIISGADDRTIRVWDAETCEVVVGPLEGHTGGIWSVAFSPDGRRIISGADDRTIRVWDAETGKVVVGPLEGHTGGICSVAFSPDGRRIISGAYDTTIRVWDAETGEVVVGSLEGHTEGINSVAFSPDGRRIISGAYDTTIRVWDAETGEVVVGPLEGHTGGIWSVAFSPDGRRIISGAEDRTIRIWDAETGEVVVGPLEGHTDRIWSVAFSPDGRRIISGAYDTTIRVWDAETGEVVVGPLEGHTGGINSVAFSPNGRRIISGADDRTIRVWDAETGEVVVGPLEGYTDQIRSVAFSPDGRRIISGAEDRTIRVWDAETGEVVVGPLEGHTDRIWSVAFSPDGRRIISGADDRTIRVWDAETGEVVVGPLKGHTGGINSVAFSPDGRRIISGADDRTIRVWDAEKIGYPNQMEPCFSDSSELQDGWIVGPNSELLFWVPPSIRDGLWQPSNVAVIGNLLTTRLDLKNFVHGENWTLCKNK